MHCIRRQIGLCYLMVNECNTSMQCWILNHKDSTLALNYHGLTTHASSASSWKRPSCSHANGHVHTQLCSSGPRCVDHFWRSPFPTEWTIKAQSPTVPQTSPWPTPPFSCIYLWPVKNDISSWRASISICILLEAQRFRAEDISALSRQN